MLKEGGWAALNMREVARRAGVSAGALYQWFEGKDEIYAELFAARLDQGAEQFDSLSDDLDLEAVLTSMIRWVHNTWRSLGRWQLDYAEIARTRDASPVRAALAEAHERLLTIGSAKLQATAARSGRTFPDDLDAMHLIWGTATGVAQRAEILQFNEERHERMIQRAVRSLLLGLTESD